MRSLGGTSEPVDPHGRTEEERAYYSLERRVYRIFARFYDAVTFPIRRLRREVARLVDPRPGTRVLDVATGTGAQALAFAQNGAEVIGIDLSEAMLRVARRKNRFPNLTFGRGDAAHLPFDDRTFDVSCVSFALHEMPESIREEVIREMARVTRPGGTIVVVDYALPRNRVASWLVYHLVKLYERDPYARFVLSDLEALLRRAGIEVSGRRSELAGAVRIVIGRRSEAAARTSSDGRVTPGPDPGP